MKRLLKIIVELGSYSQKVNLKFHRDGAIIFKNFR